MTRFEASVIMFMVMAIMLILLVGVISIISTLNDIKQQHENIKDSILDDSKGILALVDIVDKMHRNLCVEIADKMVDRVYPPTYITPCYAPDNIRKWDCVNCPKRSTCGILSTNTSIKAEDAPLQERFNDNKED